jgi:predicted DNA-binding protein
MTKGITTSIRLTLEVRQQLEYLSHSLHRGKNWIVNQALQEFIIKKNHTLLAQEAQRQSLIASQITPEDEELWEQNTDEIGWKN